MNFPSCNLEARPCLSPSLVALLTSSIPSNLSGFTNTHVVCSTQKHLLNLGALASLLRNNLFWPALTDSTLINNKGLTCFYDFYKDVFFHSFMDLAGEFHLPPSHPFRYFQIGHCAKPLFPVFLSSPWSLQWEDLLSHDPPQKSLISKVYNEIFLYSCICLILLLLLVTGRTILIPCQKYLQSP